MADEKNRKTLADIVAELRMGDDGGKPAYRIGRADKVEVSMPSGTPVRSCVIEYVTIRELADWIEAAAKRERDRQYEPKCDWSIKDALALANTLANHGLRDGNADAASSCIYSLCRELRAAAAKYEATAEKSLAVGNAAVMRQALEAIAWHAGKVDNIGMGYADACEIAEVICSLAFAALAAPARNCDRFQTVDDAKRAYIAERGHVYIWDGDSSERFERWLFKPAEEGAAP